VYPWPLFQPIASVQLTCKDVVKALVVLSIGTAVLLPLLVVLLEVIVMIAVVVLGAPVVERVVLTG